MNSFLRKSDIQTLIPKIKSYLVKQNWVQIKESETLSIWCAPDKKTTVRIINPNIQAEDSLEFIESTLEKLANYFKSSIELVLQAILNHQFPDKLGRMRFRVIADDVANGTIAFSEGIELLKSTRSFIENFVRSTQKKKAIFTGKKTTTVTNFMNEMQLGQTQKGSYVINVYYPIEQLSPSEDLTQTSFAECVNQNITSGLAALSAYLNNEKNAPKNPGDFIQKGISSNLCESLIRLSGKDHHRDVEVSLYDDQANDRKHTFLLKKSNITQIKYIAQKLAKDEFEFDKYEVIGKVIERHSLSGNNEEGGRITVKMEIYGRMRSINVELDPQNYKLANRAVNKNKQLRLLGKLRIKKGKGELIQPTNISILDDERLF